MLSLEPELVQLRELGKLDTATATTLIARERREVVSLFGELRFLTWAGVMLIVAGVGVLVSKHLDRIGPLAIAAAIGAASLACYGYSIWKRRRTSDTYSDYVLLLGALLLSADIGYIESQFHLLGSNWQRHFLLLAIVHGATAYFFDSRMVLSLSIAALASWLGIERRADVLFNATTDLGVRAFACAAIVAIWRRLSRHKPFHAVFDHAATNLAFWGALALMFENHARVIGCVIALVLASIAAWYGVRVREETFVIYAWIYGTIAVDVLVCTYLPKEPEPILLFLVVSTVAAVVGLFVTHARMRRTA